jgi:hypothetical protein
MALPGETIASGAPHPNGCCPDCGLEMPIKVCMSAAGYYIGTFCDQCGPYSRESGYYRTHKLAEADLKCYIPRSTEFQPATL